VVASAGDTGYTAYTPRLAQANVDHLLGAQAPENVVFRVQTVDDRLPTLDDGPSWPYLLHLYALDSVQPEYLILHRRPQGTAPVVRWQGPKSVRLGAELVLPTSRPADPVGGPAGAESSSAPAIQMARMQIGRTLWGGLIHRVFRNPPLELVVTTADGQRQTFRLPPRMAESPFILSPLVSNNADAVQLYQNPAALAHRRVVSVRVTTPDTLPAHWAPEISLELGELSPPSGR